MDAKRERRVHNTVHDDAIWRQTINYELATAKNWEKNWGFMKDAYQKLHPEDDKFASSNKSVHKLPPISNSNISSNNNNNSSSKSALIDPFVSGLPTKLTPGLSQETNPLISDWLSGYNIQQIVMYRYPIEKYSSPATTSNEIGWMWGSKGPNAKQTKLNTLEKFGKHAMGRQNILKWWGGSRESLP